MSLADGIAEVVVRQKVASSAFKNLIPQTITRTQTLRRSRTI